MSNIKSINIEGKLPYDCGAGEVEAMGGKVKQESVDGLLRMIGQMSLPTMGTRMEWGGTEKVPNRHKGVTTVYRFCLAGEEAVSFEFLDKFKKRVQEVGGEVLSDRSYDWEAAQG